MKRVPDRACARAVPRFHDGICGGNKYESESLKHGKRKERKRAGIGAHGEADV